MCLCAALRIELRGMNRGIEHGMKSSIVFLRCHNSSGPASKTRRDPGTKDEETETAILACMYTYFAVRYGYLELEAQKYQDLS